MLGIARRRAVILGIGNRGHVSHTAIRHHLKTPHRPVLEDHRLRVNPEAMRVIPTNRQPPSSKIGTATEIVRHDAGGKARPAWPKDSTVSARFSDCQRYRYQLREIWNPDRPLVLWVLMNPSVACLDHADPTLRKTGNFARIWGYGGQWVGNVHAYRSTNKNRLLEVDDPVGPDNDRLILEMSEQAQTVVLAYGQPPKQLRSRGAQVVALLRHHPHLCHLRLAQDGTPVHPLYLPFSLRPQPHHVMNPSPEY